MQDLDRVLSEYQVRKESEAKDKGKKQERDRECANKAVRLMSSVIEPVLRRVEETVEKRWHRTEIVESFECLNPRIILKFFPESTPHRYSELTFRLSDVGSDVIVVEKKTPTKDSYQTSSRRLEMSTISEEKIETEVVAFVSEALDAV